MSSTKRWGDDLRWYVGAVALGAGLMVTAAVSQPYNQNEIKQIAAYRSDDLAATTQGTRQPPLDALLGALVQHLVGEGQLRQRLVSVAAGIGTLVVVGLLLRRLGLGWAGAFSLLVLATQPLMVHYSAYARPYALPVFLSVAFVYAAHQWMADHCVRWLVAASVAACALPLTRVPEPNVFLLGSAAALAWLALRGRRSWSQAGPLAAAALAAVAFIGYPMYRSLSVSGPDFDPSAAGVAERFGAGVDEMVTHIAPWLGEWFPWWPITVVVVASALVIGDSRRRLLSEWGWAWWPLVLAPVGFLLAYHFMNPVSFALRPYRDRYAYFFLPALVFLIAALAQTVRKSTAINRMQRGGLCLLLAAGLLSQAPATARVLTEDVAPDFVQAGKVLSTALPQDATAIYVTPLALDDWRQDFMDLQSDSSPTPTVADAQLLAKHPRRSPTGGPLYVLVLAGECASSVYCDKPAPRWDRTLPGWRTVAAFDRFTLYAPTADMHGRAAVVAALLDFAEVFGPRNGMLETYAAAGLLDLQGNAARGRLLIHQALSQLDVATRKCYRGVADRRGYDPFARTDSSKGSALERARKWERTQAFCEELSGR